MNLKDTGRNVKRKMPLEDLGVGDRKTLKCILKIQGMVVWTGSTWFDIGFSGRML
jgi:hypothetical protein